MDLFSHRRSTLYFILFVAFVSHTYGETTCPSSVKVEKGTNSSITCYPDEITTDFYWYKGEADEKDLIGKLENGSAAVSKQHMGAYDIDLSASLVIRNAGLSHESLYTLVTFYANGTSEEDEVTVEITKDATTCPENVIIETCTTSNITCITDDSTVAFYWYIDKVEEKNLIGKIENRYFTIAQQYSDRYNIGRSGSLEIRNAELFHESLYILLTFDSEGIQEEDKVTLKITRSCSLPKPTESPGDGKSKPDGTQPIFLVILVLVIFIVTALIVFLFKRCCLCLKKIFCTSDHTGTMDQSNELMEPNIQNAVFASNLNLFFNSRDFIELSNTRAVEYSSGPAKCII